MRRSMLVVVATALLIIGLPTSALAGPPIRGEETQTGIDCELAGEAGTALVSVAVSDPYGSFGFLGFWPAPSDPDTEPPAWISDGASVELSADGSELAATFEMYEYVPGDEAEEPPFGALVGTASLHASLSPIGDQETFTDDFRDGNRRVRFSGTFQPLAVEGSLELPGEIVYSDLSGCLGGSSTFTFFETNPSTYVYTSDQLVLSCGWGDEEHFVGLFAAAEEFGTFADLFVVDASGTYYGFADASLTTSEFAATFELFSEMTGEVAGSATASAVLSPGERLNFMERYGNEKVKVIGESLLVDGTLVLETPDGVRELPMNDETCYAQDARVKSVITNPNPGKGPRLSNDEPAGALPLELGDELTVRTGGTSEPAEEPCIVSDPEGGDYELPWGHTAWYTIEGTGGAVTLDTAGSSFDTAMGVYVVDGTSFVQVACVDDVSEEPEFFSLQARVTIDTDAGTTYYVQVGGWAAQTGRLHLSVY